MGFGLQSLTLGPDTETVVLSLFVASQTALVLSGLEKQRGDDDFGQTLIKQTDPCMLRLLVGDLWCLIVVRGPQEGRRTGVWVWVWG